MTPTIEEVKRGADECGAEEIEIIDRNFESPEPTYFVRSFTYEQLQAFAQHWIEVGEKRAMGWISIADKLPKVGAIVLCCWDKTDSVWTNKYLGSSRWYGQTPTHWMELPKAIRNNTGE